MAGTAHTGIPASFTQVFPPSRLALLSLADLVRLGIEAGALDSYSGRLTIRVPPRSQTASRSMIFSSRWPGRRSWLGHAGSPSLTDSRPWCAR